MFSATGSRLRDAIGLCVVLFVLASCGGGGGGSSPPAPGSKLFIADGGNHAIASIINATPTVGSTFSPDRAIQGSSTGLGTIGGTPSTSSIPSMALDAAADRLFASTQTNVFVFDNASTANGNIPFSRSFGATVITDGVTLRGVNFFAISLDTANNRLYSADLAGEVHVFNNASTLNGPGTKTPDRTITPNAGSIIGTFGVAVDTTKDKLYVGATPNGASAFIMVFDGAAALNTNTVPSTSKAPDRTITVPGAGAFHLDQAGDRLYVSLFNGVIWVFNNASTLSGAPTPDRTIDLGAGAPVAQIQYFIFVDTSSRNKLYAVGNEASGTASIVWIIDNASTANDNGGPASDGVGVELPVANIRLSAVAVKP
jgi:hypothetical protein